MPSSSARTFFPTAAIESGTLYFHSDRTTVGRSTARQRRTSSAHRSAMTRFVDPWLSLSVGATVLTGLAALQLVVDPAVRTGPSGLRGLSRYAPLLAGGIAAFSAAVAVRLALAASSGQSASTALNTSSDACDEARPSRTGRNSSKRRGTDPKRNDSVSDGTGEPVEGKRWTKSESHRHPPLALHATWSGARLRGPSAFRVLKADMYLRLLRSVQI